MEICCGSQQEKLAKALTNEVEGQLGTQQEPAQTCSTHKHKTGEAPAPMHHDAHIHTVE
jgi:hypothetical protein